MPKKLTFKPGERINDYIVKAAASSVSGHACWSVFCALCDESRILRGSQLRSGSAPCRCIPTERKVPTHTMRSLAAQVELMGEQVITTHQMVVDLKEQLARLAAGAPAGGTPAPELAPVLVSASEPAVKPALRTSAPPQDLPDIMSLEPTDKSVAEPAKDVPEATKLKWQVRMDEISQLATDRTDRPRFTKLLNAELDSAEMDPNLERQTQRLAVHRQICNDTKDWT